MFDVSLAWSLFINHCKDSLWCLSWLVKLKEWMRMVSCLLTFLAKVKVFANAALVSWANDWSYATAIAFNVEMLDNFSC